MTTEFPKRARRDDPNGHMIVQDNLLFLRDSLDETSAKISQGSDIITSGNTFKDILLATATAIYSISVVPTGDPGGRIWVSNKSSSGFRVNLSVAAPVGGVPFDWIVKGA